MYLPQGDDCECRRPAGDGRAMTACFRQALRSAGSPVSKMAKFAVEPIADLDRLEYVELVDNVRPIGPDP